MDEYVNYRNGATARLLPDLLANVAIDFNVAKNIANQEQQATWDQWNNLYNAMNTHYGNNGAAAGDIDLAITWEWNTNNVKRDEIDRLMEKRQACSQSISSSKSGSGTSDQSPSTGPSSASGTGPGFTGVGTTSSHKSTASVTPTQCMSDGAPWLSPTAQV